MMTIAEVSLEWRKFLTNYSQQHCENQDPDDLLYVYYFTFFMLQLLKDVMISIKRTIVHDVRYLDQLYAFQLQVSRFHCQCSSILIFYDDCIKRLGKYHFRCRRIDRYHRCFYYMEMELHKTLTCAVVLKKIKFQVEQVLSYNFQDILSDFYYVYCLYKQNRIRFPFSLNSQYISIKPLGDLRSWEVICEDDDTQFLCHPCLPHPNDFLIKKKKLITNTYVSKARFEYQFKSFDKCVVVFTKTPSFIPKLKNSSYKEEKPLLVSRNETNKISLYHESILKSHHHNKKKRPLSRICKETRKKKKTKWIHHHKRMVTSKEYIPTTSNWDENELLYPPDDDGSSYYNSDYDYDYDYDYEYESYWNSYYYG